MLLSGPLHISLIFALWISVRGAENNIAFELPDLTTIMDIDSTREYQLEAFKSVNNDKIMKEGKPAKYSRLFWVSLGYPGLLKTASWRTPSSEQLFHEQEEGFYTYIRTLTKAQRRIFLTTANTKYNVNISENQILHLVLESFTCNIQLYEKGKRFLIKGEVSNFRDHPLRMDFIAPLGSRERRLFEKRLEMFRNGSRSIRLMCSVASPGQRTRVNTLTITSKSSQQLGIKEKLFGTSSNEKGIVYVTREQMNELASELFSRLSIVEEYGIPENEFSAEFVEVFIKQMAHNSFSRVSFDNALSALSKYTLDISDDLKPDIIKRDMSKIFKIENTNNKSHIVVNEEQSKAEKDGQSTSWGVSVNGGYGPFHFGTSVNTAKSQSKEWSKGNKSLKDQLRELNRESTDNVEWTIEGTKVVPKSINVAKIVRAKFVNTLSFERIRRYITEAPFQRKFSLYTHSSKLTDGFYCKDVEKTALKDQNEAFQLKQDFLEKSFLNFEYKAKLQKQPKAQAPQQSKKEKAEPTPSPNEKQIDKHAPKRKYVDRRCQIMPATVYGEFKPIEPEGESYLHDIGQWKCLCCLPGAFGLKSGERKLRLQIHTRGFYLIYVKIVLGAMPTKDHVGFQLSVDGEKPAWRSCALYGDRYVTCIMTGHRVLRALTDITLEVKSGVKLNIVSKLSRIEIVKIMNVKERK